MTGRRAVAVEWDRGAPPTRRFIGPQASDAACLTSLAHPLACLTISGRCRHRSAPSPRQDTTRRRQLGLSGGYARGGRTKGRPRGQDVRLGERRVLRACSRAGGARAGPSSGGHPDAHSQNDSCLPPRDCVKNGCVLFIGECLLVVGYWPQVTHERFDTTVHRQQVASWVERLLPSNSAPGSQSSTRQTSS